MSVKKSRILRGIALWLTCVTIVVSATPVWTKQTDEGDGIDVNARLFALAAQASSASDEIAALNRRAAEIAADNKARESRMNELRTQKGKQNEFIKEVNKQIEQVQAQVTAYNQLIGAQEKAIRATEEQIVLREEQITNTEQRITQRQSQIDELDEQNKESLRQFGQIAAQTYMNSGGGSLGLFSGSSSFADIMVHAEMLRNLGERNANFTDELLASIAYQEEAIAELGEDIDELETQKAELDDKRSELKQDLAELQTTRREVTDEVNRQNKALAKLAEERDRIQGDINKLQALDDLNEKEIAKINKQIENIIKAEEERRRKENQPPLTDYSGSGFIWPVPGFTFVSSGFGMRYHPILKTNAMHHGIDIASGGGKSIKDAPIVASQSGTVDRAGPLGSYGNVVMINHGGGFSTVYAHMAPGSPIVRAGDTVNVGQTLGYVGTTGRSTGYHLHFEIRKNGVAVNPRNYV
ncbi:MAG: peptidoglycan DD-metalloendopeptidase family protein [Oscillospiraceae bacterium]|nr:peptidoglycan DD-metalloendopeptidase family protein [Oscillospiraceae bacterium]